MSKKESDLGKDILPAECEKILKELNLVLVERGKNYSDIRENSQTFDALMRELGVDPGPISAVPFHCLSNIVTKLARLQASDWKHQDSWLDIAGYAILALANIRREEQEQEQEQECCPSPRLTPCSAFRPEPDYLGDPYTHVGLSWLTD